MHKVFARLIVAVLIISFFGYSSKNTYGQGAQPVTWTDGVNVSISSNTLTKNVSTSGWNAGAVSLQTLDFGDGYVEATIAQDNINMIFGLSKGNTDENYTDIDFALYVHSSGQIFVFDNGANLAAPTSYASGDIVRVEVSGSNVLYKKNGVVFYTLEGVVTSSIYPLLVDTSLHTDGVPLSNVEISGFSTLPADPQPTPIVWTAETNLQITDNEFVKTSGGHDWNAGAVSLQTLDFGDGYVEATVPQDAVNMMIGLSKGDTNVHFNDIDFALYVHSSGTIYVFDNGANLAAPSTYSSGDIVRVEVSGSNVKFKKNGVLFYTLSNVISANSYPILVDTSIHTQGTGFTNVGVVGFNSNGAPEPDPPPDPDPTDPPDFPTGPICDHGNHEA